MHTQYRIKLLKSASFYKTALDKQEVAGYLQNESDKLSFDAIARTTKKALGGKKIGKDLDIILKKMGTTIGKVIRQLCAEIEKLIKSGGKKTSPEDVNKIVESTIDQFVSPSSSEQLDTSMTIQSSLNKEIRFIKLAYIYFIKQADEISAQDVERTKKPVNSFLKKFYSLVFKVALAEEDYPLFANYKSSSAPSGRQSSSSKDEPSWFSKLTHSTPCTPVQTKYKTNLSYSDSPVESGWTIDVNKDMEAIKAKLKEWAIKIYPSVDKPALNSIEVAQERSSTKGARSLNELAEEIFYHNLYIEHMPYVFIPKKYQTKKEIVDCFIDKVVEVSGSKNITTDRFTSPSSIPENTKAKTESPSSVGKEAPIVSAPKTAKRYPIVISQKWQSQMNEEQKELMSKLTPEEQKQVENYLDNIGIMEGLKIKAMNDQERLDYFKQKVKAEIGEDAYRRVNS